MVSGGRVRFELFCSQWAAAGKPVGQVESASEKYRDGKRESRSSQIA